MSNKVYLVYSFSNECPDAVCLDRGVANDIAKFLELHTGKEFWVAVKDLAGTLEQFKEDY